MDAIVGVGVTGALTLGTRGADMSPGSMRADLVAVVFQATPVPAPAAAGAAAAQPPAKR